MKLRINIINILTFWIPIPKIRRFVRNMLAQEKNVNKNKIINAEIIQDYLINRFSLNIESLIVILVPEHNVISGGIQSMFSIAKFSEDFKFIHKSEVILMTRPNKNNLTIVYNNQFENKAIIYRFDQLKLFKNLKRLIIHIPEESCSCFYNLLTPKEKQHLKKIQNLQINIMNQNIELMPERKEFKDLYKLTHNITQTVAFHRYCSQEIANKYQLPTHLIPPYTDLSNYPKPSITEKKNIILYSPDKTDLKDSILQKIKRELSNFKLIEIKDITFNKYMDLVTKAKYMITFGEGYDGYFAQSMLMNGICFAVYNMNFFPKNFNFNKTNIFNSYEEMKNNIVFAINFFENNLSEKEKIITYFNSIQNKLYQKDDYLKCIENFYKKKYNFIPNHKDNKNVSL